MSQLEVDKVIPQSGTTLTLGESGDTVSVPSGATLDASNATLTLPDGSVTTAKLAYDPNPFRNIVINGDMSLAQRSTSVASITTGGYKTVDRFDSIVTTLGTWTQSQSTDTPTGQGFATSLKMDCTTADASPAASDRLLIFSKFEGQNLQYLKKGTANAVPLTLSFWVKSTKTGTFICELNETDNSRAISKSYTVNTTDTWEKKTITFEGDTTGAFTNDNGESLGLIFWLGAGTNFTSGTLQTTWGATTTANRAVGQVNIADSDSNEWYITGVQLEAGTTASDFEFLPVDVNLARCQRYFYQIQGNASSETTLGLGFSNTTTNSFSYLKFPTTMRTTPTITGSSGLQVTDGNSYTIVVTAVAVHQGITTQMNVQTTVASGLTALRVASTSLTSSATSFLALSSEL